MPNGGSLQALTVGLGCSVALLLPLEPPEIRLVLALAVAAALGTLTGFLLLPLLDPNRAWDGLDVALLAGCLAVAVVTLIAGVVSAIPGPITAPLLAAASIILMLPLGLLALRRDARGRTLAQATLWHVALLVLVAAPLRLVDLGFSEFQGDEASILHRASAIVQDVNAALLAHRKGPGEIFVATYFGELVGRVTEADARMPFAVVSVLGVLAVYAAGRAMFGAGAALVAGLLWAVNGYAVGFGRIVQYHSVTVLLSTVALLYVWRSEELSAQRWPLRQVALGLLALGLVFGFNAVVLGLPALLVLGASVLRERRWRDWLPRGRRLRPFDAVIALALVAAAIYVALEWRDMARNLSFRMGHGQPFNNFDEFASVSVRYLGQPYLLMVVSAGLGAAVWLGARGWPNRRLGWLAGIIVGGSIVLLVTLHGEPTWLAMAVWGLLAVACLHAPLADRPLKLLGVVALIIMALYGFLLDETGTHWYEAFPALALLVGGLGARVIRPMDRSLRVGAVISGAIFFAVMAVYPYYTFIPLWPPGTRMPAEALFRPSWRFERLGGNFGFPHQDGLKAISLLNDLRTIPRPYDSNASPEVTRWYMPNAERCDRPRVGYITLPTERRPSGRMPGRDVWVVLVRGVPAGVVRDQTATTADPPARISNEAPSLWFDERNARLERPLTVARQLCRQTMSPSWRRN